MKTKNYSILIFAAGLSVTALAQQPTQQRVTDQNTALHAMQPDYKVPYGPMKTEDITAVLTRIFNFLDESTPAKVLDRQTKAEITDLTKLTPGSNFAPGVFRLVSYEWGVAYGAMLQAGDATGDAKFTEYTTKRINLIGSVAKYYKSQPVIAAGYSLEVSREALLYVRYSIPVHWMMRAPCVRQ